MDSLIPPINNPQAGLPPSDKPLGGVIENLPAALPEGSITPGQSAMLEVLADFTNSPIRVLSGKIQVTLQQQLLEIPVEVKLDTPLKLPADQPVNQLNVRLSPQPDGALGIKIVAVNNDPPEKFAVRSQETPLRPQADTSALIKDTGSKLPPMEIAPLKAAAVVEKLAAGLKLPSPQIQALVRELAPVSGQVSVQPRPLILPGSPLPHPPENTAQQPLLPQSLPAQPELPPPLSGALLNVEKAVADFAAGKLSLPQTVSLIKNEFAAVKNISIPAEIVTRPENGVTVIRSPLAEVLVENPVKLGSGLPVFLKLDGFFQKVGDEIFPLLDEHLSTAAKAGVQAPKPLPADNLMKILQPLADKGQQNLAAAILNKIPESSSPRMLANMVAYIKAAGGHNLSRWLGPEIIDKLGATAEGREAAAKLGSMFVASHQDGINWRIMEIPILNNGTLSKIRIAVKKILDEEEKKKSKQNRQYGTRFVVDTSFSRLGSFQFDGYSLVKDKRFDLIIRTEREINSDFCANIMRLFKNTLHEEGYVGNVMINVKEKFIKICDNQPENETLADGIYI